MAVRIIGHYAWGGNAVPRKTFQLQFPSLGVVRRYVNVPSRSKSEFATPYSVNTRLEDALTSRLRGGSFTGLAAGTKSSPEYRDRAITFSTNAITAARQGNSTDTTLSADISDTARPIAFQLAEAGSTGGTVVAVVPHKDAYLLCFTASETWVLHGDPATGGLRRISDQVGIIGSSAWCVDHDTVYWLSEHGVYSAMADGSGLKDVSGDKIPEDLTGVTDAACVLDYNHADGGIYITRSSGVSWFYDTGREAFWPYDRTSNESHILLGPFMLGRPNAKGRVLNLHGVTATGSADVTWRIVTGDTAEDAAANGKAGIVADLAGGSYTTYVRAEGTWTAGRSHMAYPRIPAVWCVLWLRSEGTWAFEEVIMEATLSGRWR